MSHRTFEFSRRRFAALLGFTGFGSTLGTTFPETPVDLPLPTLARILGSGKAGEDNLGWFEGTVILVGGGARAEELCRYGGVSRTRVGGQRSSDFRVEHCEVGFHESITNPLTGASVLPPPLQVQTWSVLFEPDTVSRLRWSRAREQVLIEEPLTVLSVRSDDGGEVAKTLTVRSSARHTAPVDLLNRSPEGLVPVEGSWMRVAPVPDWLGVCGTHAHCIYQCHYWAGFGSLTALPRKPALLYGRRLPNSFFA